MKNKEETIKKHSEEFLDFFKTGRFKSVYVDSFFLDSKLGVSRMEEACISLLILKHLYPKHIVFGEKERTSHQIDFGSGLNEIIENFFIDKWLDYSKLKHQGFEVFRDPEHNLKFFAEELKSKKLRKTKPFNYLIQNLFNKLPANLLNKDFDKFVREILKKMLKRFRGHNVFSTDLITKIATEKNPKKILSLDGAFITGFFKTQKEIYCGNGHTDFHPDKIINLLIVFGEKTIKKIHRELDIAALTHKIKINEKYDLILLMIDDNDDTFIEQTGNWYGYEHQYGLERKGFLNDLIVEIEKSLYKDGRAILYLENNFIFSKNNLKNIKTLVDNSFLSGVIYLKNYTVFILEKNKDLVSFFRGGEFVRFFNPSEKTKPFLDVDGLLEEYKNKVSKNFNYLSRKRIQAPDTGYNLQEKSIFWKPPQGTPLKECSTILNGKKVFENDIAEKNRIIKIKDLSKNASKLIIDEDPDVETSFSLSSVSKFQEIKQTALLLAKKGNKLKPTIFEYNDKPIYISSNIIALSNKKNKVLLEYLVMAISASEHKGNTFGIHRGATIPYITNDDVENKVFIELPPIKTQKTIIEQKLREEIASIKEIASQEKLQLENIVVDAFKEIDHKIRNDLKNIKNATNKIQNFFKANTGLEEEINEAYRQYFGKKEDIYVPLEMIKTNISKSTKLLNVVRDRSSFLDPERYPEKLIAIEEIITHFRDSFLTRSYTGFSLQLLYNNIEYFNESEIVVKEGQNTAVKINITQWEYLINELINNAEKYAGFSKSNKGKVRALFSFNPMEDSFLKMVLENNGSPFPPIIKSIEDFAKNKNTSDIETGQGYGGGMVKRIADKYSLDPILISDSNNEFPVKFIFKFQTHELV